MILIFDKMKIKRYYTNVRLWKTCGKLVENLWKTPEEKSVIRKFSTAYPQDFHSFIHRFSTGLCPLEK
jgi:hypothetical protein